MEALAQVVPPEDLATYPPLRVTNPVSSEWEYLRPSLRANALRTIAANVRQHDGELAIFEAARVYLTEPDGPPIEREHVTGAVAGRREDRWGHASGESVDFYDAKGYVESALHQLGTEATFDEAPSFGLVPGRTAEIKIGGDVVGTIGQVHPRVASWFDIDHEVYLFELVVDDLLPRVPAVRRAESISRFPPVVQDIAIVVDRSLVAARARKMIEAHPLVRSAQVFDVYEGDRIPAGKKSLAFSVTYQSPEKTLTDEDVAKAQKSIVERLRKELGAELRG
jgi:phenylalanyl-tRNA synthetase beta chain